MRQSNVIKLVNYEKWKEVNRKTFMSNTAHNQTLLMGEKYFMTSRMIWEESEPSWITINSIDLTKNRIDNR